MRNNLSDDWDTEDFVFLDSDKASSKDDKKSTGKAAAIALQRELVQHGTKNPKKIDRLRRASMQPDDAGAAMMAAASAMADKGADPEAKKLGKEQEKKSKLSEKERAKLAKAEEKEKAKRRKEALKKQKALLKR